ncbi:MAG: pilus assembly protein PilM, partial [Candidatus Omnitrophica bacterium]|nr:pilus assembly protein PilM [Candidatus Omnitrophota bacterium]
MRNKRMGLFSDKTKTAIEIRESEIKVLQISSGGQGAVIGACVSEAVASNDAKAASETLRKILKDYNIKPKETILVIPRQSVTTKTMSLPSRDPAEIEEMAGFQAVKQIPYPKEEIAYGVSLIETTAEGYSKVMLVICHKDMVERPLEVMRGCGFFPSKVTLSSFGILNWLRMDPEFMAGQGAAPVIVVECDKSATDIVIADKERVIYTRGLTFGSGEGGDYIERLKEEISRTL